MTSQSVDDVTVSWWRHRQLMTSQTVDDVTVSLPGDSFRHVVLSSSSSGSGGVSGQSRSSLQVVGVLFIGLEKNKTKQFLFLFNKSIFSQKTKAKTKKKNQWNSRFLYFTKLQIKITKNTHLCKNKKIYGASIDWWFHVISSRNLYRDFCTIFHLHWMLSPGGLHSIYNENYFQMGQYQPKNL